MIASIQLCGCSHLYEGLQAKSTFQEANDSFGQGSYEASLSKYGQIVERYPSVADRALFEMGIIYTHPNNEQKDDQKALGCFQKIIKDSPGSVYRPDAEMMIFYINNVTIKDKKLAAQQTQIGALEQKVKAKGDEVKAKEDEIITQLEKIKALEQEINGRGNRIVALQKTIVALEQKVLAYQNGPAEKVLIEKKERRLTLISKKKVLATYKIALGGNPEGRKERLGDHKTPEGTYFIDSKNKNSRYHLALHISYPNEKDKKRAKELGVSPGGNIMIHGIKNGLSWVGDDHTEIDWTEGCIAVTDEEIEEIDKLVSIGTIVEIKPEGKQDAAFDLESNH